MTILLWAVPTEPPVAMVARELRAIGADVVALHPREVACHRIEVVPTRAHGRAVIEGTLTVGDREIALHSIAGVYVRPVEPECVPGIAELPEVSPLRRHARRVHDALIGFTEAAPTTGCRVMNRLSAMASNMSKPFQAQVVVRHGFSTPATIVTDDPDEVRAFAAEHHEIIYKSISGIRSIVTTFDQDVDDARLARLRWCPVQFQERVHGFDVRVHVIGDEVFAVRIESDAIDYRYAQTQSGADARLTPYEIDGEVARRCIALAADLQLPFAGIDLKLAADDRVVCFEVNPSPGFSWFETQTDLPMAAAVARWLAKR